MLCCPVARQRQREGNVEMGANAKWVSELLQERVKAISKGARKRLKCGSPRRILQRKFAVEREEPCPAVGTLKRSCHWSREEREFARDLFGNQHFIGARANLRSLGKVRILTRNPHHLPPAVNATVPIKTAMKDWMERDWRYGVLRAIQHEIKLVWILSAEMAKRCARKLRGDFGGQAAHRNASR